MLDIYRNWYDRYCEKLEQNEGVKSGAEYLENYFEEADYGVLGSSDDKSNPKETLPLSAFARMNRPRDQDIALVLANPKLSSNLVEDGGSNHLYDFVGVDPYSEKFFKESEAAMRNWFLKNENQVRNLLQKLDGYDLLQLPGTDSSEVQQYIQTETGLVEDIYYTNWYKFATHDDSDIKEGYYSVANEVLSEELKAVNPNVTFVLGRKAWKRFAKGEIVPFDTSDEIPTAIKNTDKRYWSPELGWIVPTYHLNPQGGTAAGGLPDDLDFTREG